MKAIEVNNGMDIIDSRDIIARIRELEDLRDTAKLHGEELRAELTELEAQEQDEENTNWTSDKANRLATLLCSLWLGHDGTEYGESSDYDEETDRELKALLALQEQCNYGDWKYGETLIRDAYFEEYARELANDLGSVTSADKWPATCIDWEQASEELKQDYSRVDFDGEEYWIRA